MIDIAGSRHVGLCPSSGCTRERFEAFVSFEHRAASAIFRRCCQRVHFPKADIQRVRLMLCRQRHTGHGPCNA